MIKRIHLLSFGLALSLSTTVLLPAASPLAGESSAYLQAQAGSPVNWIPWGEAAFAKAKSDGKPVFVFIGSASSELSRAMAKQSFANADTAALLNQTFICVLVDREEHPEVVSLYQTYLSEIKQLNGQPINLWLTPELLPYEGAAYLPPTEEWGKSSFLKIAQQAKAAWDSDPAGCRTRAKEAVAQLAGVVKSGAPAASSAEKSKTRLSGAAESWRGQFDAANGGFTEAPKGLEPELLRFMLKQSPADHDAAVATLRAIANSAVRDPLDGGFFRYATDARWHLPYAQKSLSDQARMALAYLDAAKGDDAKAFGGVARGALDYALTQLARPDGTFDAAEDATGEDLVGYNVWTTAEIDAALDADAEVFKKAHGVEAAGNITSDEDLSGKIAGKNILRATLTPSDGDAAAVGKLLAVRSKRATPSHDQGASAGVHGLLLAALARAGEQLNEPRFAKAAAQLYGAIGKHFVLSKSGELRRLRDSSLPAAPFDYAAVALGCREFSRTAHQAEAGELADHLMAKANTDFFDAVSGRYHAVTATLPAGIFVRAWAISDLPSAESLTIQAGASTDQVKVIAAALAASVDEVSAPPAGEILLALSLAQ